MSWCRGTGDSWQMVHWNDYANVMHQELDFNGFENIDINKDDLHNTQHLTPNIRETALEAETQPAPSVLSRWSQCCYRIDV